MLTTREGVTVVVKHLPPPKPAPEPEPVERAPRVVIRPPGESARAKRDAIMAQIVREESAFIRSMLVSFGVLAESAKDLGQQVLMVLAGQVEKDGKAPDNVRGFLVRVMRNAARNHKRRWWKRSIEPGVDVEIVMDLAPDPEGEAQAAEYVEKLSRYADQLSEEELALIRYINLEGLSVDDTALRVGRPPSTVAWQHARAVEKLQAMARASERAAELGMRRR
jgi:RNA polymerase sigma factor (sigma-70 family)